MTFANDRYAAILRSNKILYVPSCLLVEMLTKIYGEVSRIMPEKIEEAMPELIATLQALGENFRVTAEAYEENRSVFFVGDWKDDKLRARKLFFNLISKFGHLSEMMDYDDRITLFRCAEEVVARWTELDQAMERKSGHPSACCTEDSSVCRYFRSIHPGSWQQTMGNILMSLHLETVHYAPGTYLILLCYNCIRSQLLRVIQNIERKSTVASKFPIDKILVLSDEDAPVSCPKCTLMVDGMRRENRASPSRGQAAGTFRKDRVTVRRKVPLSPTAMNRYLTPETLGRVR